MKTVKEILDTKGREVWGIEPDAAVFEAVKLMAEKEVGALVVTTGDKLVGIISERDCARKVILMAKAPHETPTRDIMTTQVLCARLEQTVEECMAMVTDNRVRHLPVLDQDRVVGIISIGDLVKTIIDEQQFMIEQLEHYISG